MQESNRTSLTQRYGEAKAINHSFGKSVLKVMNDVRLAVLVLWKCLSQIEQNAT
ncbi:uncharacterized protein RCO7_14195 [Rhynchosporium graminicola]|uniref:Uncharacterized protein n=1 Tax=Rhynchosporium graminicola TaxID=2792576 RepID=A0A1E1JYQ4_9HELO|nr:uncharacterized protein RCO7_14195 [Rhynchosporium commune]